MVLPLVVGVDGPESSLHAVDWAVDEAVRHGLSLHRARLTVGAVRGCGLRRRTRDRFGGRGDRT
ncbi:universal stress protein [Streptomyces sp. NPDC002814]